MKKRLLGLFATLIFGSTVSAQPQIGSYNPPVYNPQPLVSPYLNLNNNRGGVNPAINYFGIVRPQIENQQAVQQLQLQVQANHGLIQGIGQGLGQVGNEEIGPTGHAMGGFFNYGHYYPLYSRGGGGTGFQGNTFKGNNFQGNNLQGNNFQGNNAQGNNFQGNNGIRR